MKTNLYEICKYASGWFPLRRPSLRFALFVFAFLPLVFDARAVSRQPHLHGVVWEPIPHLVRLSCCHGTHATDDTPSARVATLVARANGQAEASVVSEVVAFEQASAHLDKGLDTAGFLYNLAIVFFNKSAKDAKDTVCHHPYWALILLTLATLIVFFDPSTIIASFHSCSVDGI